MAPIRTAATSSYASIEPSVSKAETARIRLPQLPRTCWTSLSGGPMLLKAAREQAEQASDCLGELTRNICSEEAYRKMILPYTSTVWPRPPPEIVDVRKCRSGNDLVADGGMPV